MTFSCKYVLALALTLLLGHPALAQQNDWGLPDSPNGNLASALLDAINSPDSEVHRAFVNDHFVEAFKNQFPMDAHVMQFQQMHQDLAGASVNGVNLMMGTVAVLDLLMQTKHGAFLSLQIEMEQGATPLIAGLRVEESSEPASDQLVRALLETINSPDAEVHRAFIDEYFSPVFKDELPMESHLDQFRRLHEDLAGAETQGMEAMSHGGGTETVSILMENASGSQFNLTFDFQLTSPPRLFTLAAIPV